MKKVKILLFLILTSIGSLILTGCEIDEAIPFVELFLNFLYLL